jgi:hypothetical protein
MQKCSILHRAFFMIIGVCGFIGSGKDTVADYLVNYHGFHRDSFAATLKDAVSVIFGWDRELVEGRTKSAREWREQVDPWWANRLNIPDLTPRYVLQQWGTEVCRRSFHDDIWIASLENKLRSAKDNIVISDCRFPNEIASIKAQGGKVIWVQRGDLPAWYSTALLDNKSSGKHAAESKEKKHIGMKYQYPEVHPSEYSWIGAEFDAEIDNNGTIDHLCSQIKNLVQS